MILLILIYLSIIIISIVISFSSLKKILINYKNKYDKENPEKWVEENLGAIDIEELKETKQFFIAKTKSIFLNLHVIINFPIFILRMALIARYGIKIVWKLPFQIYELWWIFIYAICFNLARNDSAYLAIIFSTLITFSIIIDTVSTLDSKKGQLKILDKPDHKIRIYDLITNGLLIIVGFACIYFSLSILNIDTFNQSMSIIDSLFYSFMIGTTIGFGNILPISNVAKMITMLEGFLGFMFVVFMIGIFINIWIGKRTIIKQ